MIPRKLRIPATVLVALAALATCGCTPSDASPPTSHAASPTPMSTPMFASDDEALKAATEVYRKLITTEFGMYPSGALDRAKIEPFATDAYLAESASRFKAFVDRGVHATGGVKVTKSSIQSLRQSAGSTEVVIYACIDASAFRVIDAAGADITPGTRADLLSNVATLRGVGGASLKVEKSELWSGQSVC
ncbi:MAG TPA: hypothetical protein VFU07_02115 [Candidatus Lumbricidophila sp.]|nr:hypothetical protein [Candidatus Lumbricidophila sp.]